MTIYPIMEENLLLVEREEGTAGMPTPTLTLHQRQADNPLPKEPVSGSHPRGFLNVSFSSPSRYGRDEAAIHAEGGTKSGRLYVDDVEDPKQRL